ncbi:MAG TPA: hypothetical protein VHX68_17835 [Planctomycetaceae bacterium]|nr:hypothetical protein [Planctomycetaceae bacterium]
MLAAISNHISAEQMAISRAERIGLTRDGRGDDNIVIGIGRNDLWNWIRRQDDQRAGLNLLYEFAEGLVTQSVNSPNTVVREHARQLCQQG